MNMQEYRVEVLYKNNKTLLDIWNPIGYGDIFHEFKDAEDDMNYRKQNYPNRKYRIVRREVSEWEVVE